MNFSTAFEKEHGVFYLASGIVDNVAEMVSSNFLTGKRYQIYLCFIQAAKLLHQCSDIINIVEDISGKETKARTLRTSYLEDRTLFSKRTEKGPLQVRAANEYDRNPVMHHPFNTRFSTEAKGFFLYELHGLYPKRSTTERI